MNLVHLKPVNGDFLIIDILLLNRSLCAETHWDPDGTRLKQNAQARLKSHKHAGQLLIMKMLRKKQI